MPPHPSLQRSESQARRSSALESALGPIADFLADERVVEVMLNADGAVWIERHGEALLRTAVRMAATESDRMLRLVAAEMLVELNAQRPSLSAKLPPPWSARLQTSIPPIVDAPVFALRKPASVVFSLDDYRLRSRRRMRLYVFRTLEVADRLVACVPGVRPRVQLLLDLTSARRVWLARGLFSYLVKNKSDPTDLPDAFYLRVSAALAGRLPPHKVCRRCSRDQPASSPCAP